MEKNLFQKFRQEFKDIQHLQFVAKDELVSLSHNHKENQEEIRLLNDSIRDVKAYAELVHKDKGSFDEYKLFIEDYIDKQRDHFDKTFTKNDKRLNKNRDRIVQLEVNF